MFQFQDGSIGRFIASAAQSIYVSFNSSMVRLGEIGFNTNGYRLACFNSSMVRLGETVFLLANNTEVFQFQYGSIGRKPGIISSL